MIIESNKRMSQSLLWKLQKAAYLSFGPKAWSHCGVPFYLTSNPFTAKQYAHVVVGYLRDCLARQQIATSEPIYFFDLGAGTGRFAYLFLKELRPLLQVIGHSKLNFCYVMTDMVKSNLEFCSKHPQLNEFFNEGILDLAEYHHAQNETPLFLMHSKKNLSKESIRNPVILIANYFFDTIPQDLFKVEDGKLYEGRLTLEAEGEAKEPLDPALITSLRVQYEYSLIDDVEHYYSLPGLSSILQEYAARFQKAIFLFPIGAFQSLTYFSDLSQGRVMLIAGDQAVCTEEQIEHWGEPKIAKHASFSIAVNYHAIARYFNNKGGCGLLTSNPDPVFAVVAGVLGGENKDQSEVALAFRTHIDAFEPSDYLKVISDLEKQALKLETLLMLLKLGNWDPMNFYAFFEKIRKEIPQASPALKRDLQQAIHKTYANFYSISSEDGDFILNLGVLLFDLGLFADALTFFQRSLAIKGANPAALKNIEACKKKMLNDKC